MTSNLEILLDGQQFKKIYEIKYDQVLRSYGLTKLEIEILLFLESSKPSDTARDIVGSRLFAKSHVSKAITALIDDGYVLGNPDEHDRRCIHLKLSDNAKQIVKEAKEIRDNITGILFEGVSLEEKKIMEIVARKIANNIKITLKHSEERANE